MCKYFFNKELVVILLIICAFLNMYSQQDLYQPRSLSLDEGISQGLYHYTLSKIDPYRDMASAQDMDRHKIISILHTRYPNLAYELERTPQQTLESNEVSMLLTQILKEESSADMLDTTSVFWRIVDDASLAPQERTVFAFLYAYELFKQRRFAEADRIFDKVIQERKEEYEYALYYSGLIALLNKDYPRAQTQLKRIGKHQQLKLHTPYYLAASHYGNKDYHTIVKYYEGRLSETQLHNIQGIIKIVAHAQYQSEDYKGTIASLSKLQSKRELLPSESYMLGIAYQRTGDNLKSSQYLNHITNVEGTLAQKAQYEQAINLSNQHQYAEAIGAFESLMTTSNIDKNEIHWNLALLNGKISKYDKLAFHAIQLINSPRHEQATALLTKVIDNIDNESVYDNMVSQLSTKLSDSQIVLSSLYRKAVTALHHHDQTKAQKYFDMMADIDPSIEERGNVAAWRGLMAYHDHQYEKATRLLSNYQKTRAKDATLTKLDFDVSYFLGYSQFKLKRHSEALGYFAQALNLINYTPNDSDRLLTIDDLYLRIGDSYFLIDEYSSAHRSYTQVVDNNGHQKDYALWQTAIIAELENRPYDQILILDEIMSDYPKSRYYNRAKLNIANALFTLKDFSKAAELYKSLLASDTPLSMKEESMAQLGLISVNAGDYKRAEEYFVTLVESATTEEMVHRSQLALKEIYANYTNNTDAYLDLVHHDNKNDHAQLSKALFSLALDNYENGELNPAIEQWEKLIADYPNAPEKLQSHLMLAKTYEDQKQWKISLYHYTKAIQHTDQSQSLYALNKAMEISVEHEKDYVNYIQLADLRTTRYPDVDASPKEYYQLATALIATNDFDKAIVAVTDYATAHQDASPKLTIMTTDLSTALFREKDWDRLLAFYNLHPIKDIVNNSPKLIYQRSLARFNKSHIDEAYTGITDHYDTLLNEPAWLAKGIILISDINILKGDKDSAAAALEALISSSDNIPMSLKETAKEKLNALELQN